MFGEVTVPSWLSVFRDVAHPGRGAEGPGRWSHIRAGVTAWAPMLCSRCGTRGPVVERAARFVGSLREKGVIQPTGPPQIGPRHEKSELSWDPRAFINPQP